MKIYTNVFENQNHKITANMWTILKELEFNFVFSAEILEPHIIKGKHLSVEGLIANESLKKGNKKIPVYQGQIIEDSPFYFERSVIYIGGVLQDNILIPPVGHLLLKVRNAVDDFLKDHTETRKQGSYIFSPYGEVFSVNVQKYEGKTVFHAFVSVNPNTENTRLIGFSSCYKEKIGKVHNLDTRYTLRNIVDFFTVR